MPCMLLSGLIHYLLEVFRPLYPYVLKDVLKSIVFERISSQPIIGWFTPKSIHLFGKSNVNGNDWHILTLDEEKIICDNSARKSF